MSKFVKIFLFFLFSLFILFLIYTTFFFKEEQEYLSMNFVESNVDTSVTKLSMSGSTYSNDYFEVIYTQDFNHTDSVYFSSTGSYEYTEGDDFLEINLNQDHTGYFLFNLNDIGKLYTIKGAGFEIKNTGGAMFYLDNTMSKKKNILYSLDTILELSFFDEENSEKINSAYIYPQNTIKFNLDGIKESFSQEADLFRIKSIYGIRYSSYPVIDSENGGVNEKLKFFIYKEGLNFIDFSYIFLQKDLQKAIDNYKLLLQNKTTDFIGKEYIEKYIKYFYNDSKKLSYYKLLVINDLIKLFNEKTINGKYNVSIKNNLEIIKSLDKNEYEKLLSIINGYYSVLSLNNFLIGNNSIYNFTNLVYYLDGKKDLDFEELESYIYLRKTYFSYNFNNLKVDINNYFKNFLKEYFGKYTVKNDILTLSSQEDLKKVESFIFFLEDYVKNHISKAYENTNGNIDSEIFILKKYFILSKSIYFNDLISEGLDFDKKIETGLLVNRSILENIIKYFSTKVISARDLETNSLQKRDDVYLEYETVLEYQSLVNKFLDLYDEYIGKIKIDEKDKYILNDKDKENFIVHKRVYGENPTYRNVFTEIFMFLTDINSYKSIYDDNIYSYNNIAGIIEQEETFTSSDVKNYLSNFSYISMAKVGVVAKKDTNFYTVTNLIVRDYEGNSYSMNFDISPKDGNTIQNIAYKNLKTMEEVDLKKVYILDLEKDDWDSLLRVASKEEKFKYDFKNYFVQKFFYKEDIKRELYVEESFESENAEIRVFKGEKLLGEKTGEFTSLKNVLTVDYYDLYVSNVDDIYLSGATVSSILNLSNGRRENYSGDFSGYFFIEGTNKYFGTKINSLGRQFAIRFYKGNRGTNNYITGSTPIIIEGNVDKESFKSFVDILVKKLIYVSFVYQKIGEDNLTIKYYPEGGKINFIFEKNQKNINITMYSEKVTSVKVNRVEQLESQIDYIRIGTILSKIN